MPRFTYRFSIGNSGHDGQVGFCFDYTVERAERNDDETVEDVKEALSEQGAETCMTGLDILPRPFGHICVYVNPANITKDHIVDVTEET